MAYFHIGNNIYIGVTADTKPTNIPVGAVAIDRQIPSVYVYNGSVWNQISAAGSGITASSSDTLTNKDLTSSTNSFRQWINTDISATAAIAYSKLNLSSSIVDADHSNYTNTHVSTNSKSLLNANIVYNDQANTFGSFLQSFGGAVSLSSYQDFTRIAAPANPSTNMGRMYVKQVDSNNDGIFILLKKAGSYVEVQIG